jgi:hypothetical protein
MECWRLYWHVAEARGRFEVVGAGVARPEQEIPERAMEIEHAQEFTLVKIWKRSIQI